MTWTEKAPIWSIGFTTTLGRNISDFFSRPTSKNQEEFHVKVPGKKVAFISGTYGDVIDSLTFYFN